MKHVHLTWYLLVDGTQADPNDVSPDADGVLRHKSGLAVSLHEDGTPMSIGRTAEENKNVEAAQAGDEADAAAEQMQAENTAAAKTEETAGDAVATAINPATGKPQDDDQPKDLKPEAPKRGYKTRQSKAR